MANRLTLKRLAEKLTKMAERPELAGALVTFCGYPRSARSKNKTTDTFLYAVEICSMNGKPLVQLRDFDMLGDGKPTAGVIAARIAAGEMTDEEIQKEAERLVV